MIHNHNTTVNPDVYAAIIFKMAEKTPDAGSFMIADNLSRIHRLFHAAPRIVVDYWNMIDKASVDKMA